MKVAIIHDWLVGFGGGESIVLKLLKIFPDATVYTSVYDEHSMGQYFDKVEVKTSFIQKLPFGISKYRYYLPLMPLAFEQFNLKDYDLVISSSSCCAKGVNVNANSIHFCYCHTPMRYAWDMYNEYNSKGNILKKAFISTQLHKLRQWDYISANRVDYFIANSRYIANRIKKHYRRDAVVIYPGINDEFYNLPILEKSENFYLLVTRLVDYKKVDIIVKTFNKLGKQLIIVGDGPERKKLEKMAKKNITFKGTLKENELKSLYQKCRAFVFMAEEDFGMVMAEAQAVGKPVIAYKKGGASEIVINNLTGLLIDEQTELALEEAVNKMERIYTKYDSQKIRETARKFSEENFFKEIKNYIDSKF